MYYKIIEYFGPYDNRWKQYLEWCNLELTSFDSIDGVLCPGLFEPQTEEDWQNCVNEDYKLNLITNLDYAKSILSKYNNAVIVGVDIIDSIKYKLEESLLGYDIIDSYCDISLLTNWKKDKDEENLFSKYIQDNGLIHNLKTAMKIRDMLREGFSEDSHTENCKVWAIYKINTVLPPGT